MSINSAATTSNMLRLLTITIMDLKEKTMANKRDVIPSDNTQNYPFRRLNIVVEIIEYSTLLTNQSKFT